MISACVARRARVSSMLHASGFGRLPLELTITLCFAPLGLASTSLTQLPHQTRGFIVRLLLDGSVRLAVDLTLTTNRDVGSAAVESHQIPRGPAPLSPTPTFHPLGKEGTLNHHHLRLSIYPLAPHHNVPTPTCCVFELEAVRGRAVVSVVRDRGAQDDPRPRWVVRRSASCEGAH